MKQLKRLYLAKGLGNYAPGIDQDTFDPESGAFVFGNDGMLEDE